MYNRQEAAQLRQSFWTSFGLYMAPIPAAEGLKTNWINYKTGIKDLYFKMQAGASMAHISILLGQENMEKQDIFFNQLWQVKSLLRDALQEEWQWEQGVQDENNKTVSRIYTTAAGTNIYKREDWPAIISFFKPRIIALDVFWTEVKEGIMCL